MTLATSTNRNDYIGSGITGPYPYTFRILDATDLDVRRYDPVAAVEIPLVYLTDYTVAGVGEGGGGSITLIAALAVGQSLTIRRVRPVTQPTSIRDQGAFLPELHEDAFDHQVMIDQQHEESLGRALQLPVTTKPTDAISPVLPAPQANYTLGWDASGKKLTNIAFGGRGPAGVGGPIPIFADAAARDAFYPAPAVDNVGIVKSLGYQMRFGTPATGANKWLPEGITRANGPVITAQSRGLIADGVNDDAPFLAAADAACVTSGGRHEIDALTATQTKVFINSNLTLSTHFRPNPGLKNGIYVAAGKTLTINGPFDPGLYGVFDPTSPGTVVFGKVREFRPESFGVVGNGVTDDATALNFMTRSIPDYSTVWFSSNLNIALKNSWYTVARMGIRYVAPLPTRPNGVGAQIQWIGPRGLYGTDAVTTNGSNIVTSASGQFTADMVGQILDVQGAFTASPFVYHAVTVSAVDSPTQLRASENASASVVATPYWVSGVMTAMHSSGHCRLEGITVRVTPLATIGAPNAYIANGSNILNLSGYGPLTGTHQGKKIVVYGAGPGGKDLISTVTTVNNGNQAVLADNASTAIASTTLAWWIIGPSATSLPARIGLDLDHSGINGVTGTECRVEDCLFHGGISEIPQMAGLDVLHVAIAKSAPFEQVNHEYHKFIRCAFQGGGPGRNQLQGLSITTGTNVVTAAGAVFNANQTGMRLRISGAGVPVGGRATTLDVKMIGYTSPTQITVSANAGATVAGVRGITNEGSNVGVFVGPSPNAKRQYIYDGNFGSLNQGVWQRNGSVYMEMNNFPGNEVNYQQDSGSEPSFDIQPNSENSGRHYILGAAPPTRCTGGRFGNIFQVANGGYFKLNNCGQVDFDSPSLDNVDFLAEGNTYYFEFNGFNSALTLDSAKFPQTPHYPSMQECGFGTNLITDAPGAVIRCRNPFFISDAPCADFTIGANGNGTYSVSVSDSASGPPAIAGVFSANGGGPYTRSAIRGRAEVVQGTHPAAGTIIAGVEASFGQTPVGGSTTEYDNGVEASALRVVPFNQPGNFYARNAPLHAIKIESPAAAGGQVNTMYGIRVLAQTVGPVVAGYGIKCEGASDLNVFVGLTTFGSGRIEKATVYIDIGAGGNATPNAAGAEEYRYRMAGAATANNPLNLQKGMVFKLVMFNNSAGPITPALGAKYLGTGFGAIAAAKSRSRMYMYDDVLDKLEPIGAVSEDF